MTYVDQVRALGEFLNRTDHIAADTPDVPPTPELRAPVMALAYQAACALDQQRAARKEPSMKPPITSLEPAPSISPALAELSRRGADEAERAHSRPRETYLRALDRRYHASVEQQALGAGTPMPALVPLLDALAAELAALKAAQKLRPRFAAMLSKYPAPDAPLPKPVAEQLRALRGGAQGALSTLDKNPGALEGWVQKIADVPPDCGSPTALGVAHFEEIRPLLDRARSLPGAVAELDRMARELEALAAECLARGVPVEIQTGVGPLEPNAAPRPSRTTMTELHHG